ncbi:MAG: flagellar biosynthesis protein FliQ [Lachnospiraceae bacterium]|jgi:flagellar biosynthetic protein FliQ|nr:flagellar biosynthesis protein FliQ [Lachnospiraceae bacterium]MCR5427225.1 flagellar biosynthesis protein FliQ [Lachnospiraceae bacterium]
MTTEAVTDMLRQGMYVILETALPVLLVSMAIGLLVSIFQTITSIQEQTLTFVPKLLGIFLTLILIGNWMMNNMVELTQTLWHTFSYYVHK